MGYVIFLGGFFLICDQHSSPNSGEESYQGPTVEFYSAVRYTTFLKESPTTVCQRQECYHP